MKGFIEVTDQHQYSKILLPIDRICFIRERGDGRARINFRMAEMKKPSNDFESAFLDERISDITTVEKYSEVIRKIKHCKSRKKCITRKRIKHLFIEI